MFSKPRFIYLLFLSFFIAADNIEELIVTGTMIKDAENDLSPVQVISKEDYENLNITNIAELVNI